jgi:geranylgeranyl reductase family protein
MVTIIGAGPVGSYLAYLLAKKGMKVKVFEDHKEIGKPVQCTGLLTKSVENLIKIKKEFLVNKTEQIKIISNKNSVCINAEEFIVDRTKFDNHIYNKAIDAGANFFLGHRYISNKKDVVEVKDLKNNRIKKIKTNILIGADGPVSNVAKQNNLFKNRRFYAGLQARVKCKNNGNKYEVYLGSKFPGFFGWVVPENNDIIRIGVAAKQNVNKIFDQFVKQRAKNKKIINKQAGLIPIYSNKVQTQRNKVYLIGDAAAQVKATTGGGIVPGMRCARILANSIIDNNNNYETKWKRSIGLELMAHSKIRGMLDKFSDKDYDDLISMIKKEKIRKILGKESRDNPIMLMMKLLINEPRFLRYAKFILQF